MPLIDFLSEDCKKKDDTLFVSVHYDGRPVLELTEGWQLERWRFADWRGDGLPHKEIKQINLPKVANTFGHKVYMTQAYFGGLGLPVPEKPLRPYLRIPDAPFDEHVISDFGLAPFARSLAAHEKWPKHRWQKLVDSMPEKRFILYGKTRMEHGRNVGDDPDFVKGPNVTPFFDRPLETVCRSLRTLRNGLISVSTGPSHLAYAMNVKNYLLIRQGPFACNPEAVMLPGMPTPAEVTVPQVLEMIA